MNIVRMTIQELVNNRYRVELALRDAACNLLANVITINPDVGEAVSEALEIWRYQRSAYRRDDNAQNL